tara:strand:+ start:1394 stop:1669 length:276 start_codon:yes stop_codon:yes gene_type:complete
MKKRSLKCPVCREKHDLPEGCGDGDIFSVPCGAELEAVQGSVYNGNTGRTSEFFILRVASFCEWCGQLRDDRDHERSYCDTCQEELIRGVQ